MVSVIIPTYNRAATIARSINSVLNQTYQDLELIVVDDCSTDNTEEVVKDINDLRIKFIRLDRNQGACVARNAGIEAAVGDIIAFHDSDDVWHENKLQIQLDAMKKNNADVCFCQLKRHYSDDKQTEKIFPDRDGNKFISHEQLCCAAYVSTQTIIGKKEVMQEHKFDPNVRKTQDYDWSIRASRNFTFYFVNDILVDQYLQKDSISMSGNKVVIETREYFLEKYKKEFVANPQFEIYQLQIIARVKAFMGEKPIKEMKRIYELRPNTTNKIRLNLTKLGLMKMMYRLKGYKL